MLNDDTGYRTRDLEVGHVVHELDDDWAVTELVPLAMGGVAVYLHNADGVEGRHLIAEEHIDDRVWNVVGQPDEDLFND
jgi:hypothetical protein